MQCSVIEITLDVDWGRGARVLKLIKLILSFTVSWSSGAIGHSFRGLMPSSMREGTSGQLREELFIPFAKQNLGLSRQAFNGDNSL